jgi:hypothetical protein
VTQEVVQVQVLACTLVIVIVLDCTAIVSGRNMHDTGSRASVGPRMYVPW